MNTPKLEQRRTKNQHYVPQLHLRRFLSEQPKNMIWTYDKVRGTARPSRTEETGNQKNFYSVQNADGTYSDLLDAWLQGVENTAAAPYENLLNGCIPRGQAKADFAVFVSSLYARSPALIRANALHYAQFLQYLMDLQFSTRERFESFIDRFEAETGSSVNRDDFYSFWKDKSRFTMEVSQKKGLAAMSVTDDLTDILFKRNWYLVKPLEDFFITGDSPVFKYTDTADWPNERSDGGFLNPKAEISIPLSPHVLLLITGESLPFEIFSVSAEGVWDLNDQRGFAADRFLYTHVKDDRVKEIAQHYSGATSRFEIMGAGPFAEVKVTR